MKIMKEEEYKDYGLPTEAEIRNEAICVFGQYGNYIFAVGARWMRRKAVEAIYKINEHNIKALSKILSECEAKTKADTIDKACKWLENNLYVDKWEGLCIGTAIDTKADMIADFRKAMEGAEKKTLN